MAERFDVDPHARARITTEAIRRGRRLRLRRRLVGGAIAAALVIGGASVVATGQNHPQTRVALVDPARAATGAAPATGGPGSGAAAGGVPTPPPTTEPAPTSAPPTLSLPALTVPTATTAAPAPTGARGTPATLAPPRATTTVPRVTTTTTAAAPTCIPSDFVVSESTSHTTYAVGQAITITQIERNTGGACTDTNAITSGCWFGAFSAHNSSGQLVWQLGAQPTIEPDLINCPAAIIGTPIPTGWSKSASVAWNQTDCAFDPSGMVGQPNPDCPDTQAPAGSYAITDSLATAPMTVVIGS